MHFTSPLPLPLRYLRKRPKSARTVGSERTERTDGTQDSALYTCGCGYVFKATVTTNVGCPHCGTAQAW